MLVILALAVTGGLADKVPVPAASPTPSTAVAAPTPPSAATEPLADARPNEMAAPAGLPTIAATPVDAAPPIASSRSGRPPQRIALQAGHWRAEEQHAELALLRGSTGAEGPGWAERDVNLDIARRAARLLEAGGFLVDVLPAPLPERYRSDVFLALHGDANGDRKMRGFKVARGARSAIPEVDDALVATIYRTYGQMTGLPRDDKNITSNMRYYYAFTGGLNRHAVAPTTPAAILEMGFLSNESDRRLLLSSPDVLAEAVAASLAEFLRR